MTDSTEAALTCAKCGARQTIQGTQWEVQVAAEVWKKKHERAAHDGEQVPAQQADGLEAQQRSAPPGSRV
jgi:hypothetical protein